MINQRTPGPPLDDLSVGPLQEDDLPEADRIFRLAFGTFIGLPDPMRFAGDADYVRTRWRATPEAALGAKSGERLVGSNFATNWGSVGFFGPLTVHPEFWDRSVAKRLLEPTMDLFARWQIRLAGLYTFAQSAKHVGLYQKFGFWPQYLTAVMAKPVGPPAGAPQWTQYADVPEGERAAVLQSCRELTEAVYEGLDVAHEIRAVARQGLGETVLLWDEGRLQGLAVCHCGPGTEAGSGTSYVKFGAARPGPNAGEIFERLLAACEALAAARGLSRLVAGVNTGRLEAYRHLLARGFRTFAQGVAMQRGQDLGYNCPDVYVIDDWR